MHLYVATFTHIRWHSNISATGHHFCPLKCFPLLSAIHSSQEDDSLRGQIREGATNPSAAAKSFQSCPTLCDPIDGSHQAPPSLGFSRQKHWSGLPFPSPMHESGKWKWSCSVVSDSSWPHGLQPTRLLRPWDSPGKSTGVGCHCLLQLTPLGDIRKYMKHAFKRWYWPKNNNNNNVGGFTKKIYKRVRKGKKTELANPWGHQGALLQRGNGARFLYILQQFL